MRVTRSASSNVRPSCSRRWRRFAPIDSIGGRRRPRMATDESGLGPGRARLRVGLQVGFGLLSLGFRFELGAELREGLGRLGDLHLVGRFGRLTLAMNNVGDVWD